MARPQSRDGCVVAAAPLTCMLRSFVDSWNESRPANSGQYVGCGERRTVDFVRAIDYLACETGWPDGPTAVSPSSITNIYNGRRAAVELRDADALVAALDHPEAWHDGTLEVRPNPQATRAAQARCCDASLTGTL